MLPKLLLASAAAAAASIAHSASPAAFTQEELRDQARTYVAVIERKESGSLESTIKMSRFYGYIMGYLDSASGQPNAERLFVECTKKSPKEVALKAAKAILNSKLDRAEPVRISTMFAVGAACNDAFWK
jgi:hypothetical protein